VFVKLFPKQQNLFAIHVKKPAFPDALYPWLSFDEKEKKVTFNKEWGDQLYKSPK
jgi:hypothetical protein